MKEYSLDKVTIKYYCDIWHKIELYKENLRKDLTIKFNQKAKSLSNDEKVKLNEFYENRLNNETNHYAIALLNNVSLDTIRNASIVDFSNYYHRVKDFFNHDYSPVDSFVYNNTTYYIDYNIMSYGGAMYMDLEGVENSNPSIYETMIYILSLLIYLEKDKFNYNGQDDIRYIGGERLERAEYFQSVPASIFLGIYKKFNEKKKILHKLLDEYSQLKIKIEQNLEQLKDLNKLSSLQLTK